MCMLIHAFLYVTTLSTSNRFHSTLKKCMSQMTATSKLNLIGIASSCLRYKFVLNKWKGCFNPAKSTLSCKQSMNLLYVTIQDKLLNSALISIYGALFPVVFISWDKYSTHAHDVKYCLCSCTIGKKLHTGMCGPEANIALGFISCYITL